MDLRSIINNEATESSAQKNLATPVTPSHTGPPRQVFRDYPGQQPPPQASPYRHPSQDIGQQQSYTSPTAFQGAYHTRPAPPLQLQPPSQNDLRSPATSSHHSAQSPFTRHTPTSSLSGHQYPFPPNQPPQSPNQIALQQQQQQQQQRDSYSHNSSTPLHIPNHNPYNSVSLPHTPPVGTPGGSYPYPPQHQRSQSSHSTSTPTSAQSQHQFYGHIQDSPVSQGHPQHIQAAQHPHHQSQPGTPLGPPISIPRQSSGNFQQPQSPYSQRAPSIGGFAPPYSGIQTSPAHPQPPQIARLPSTPTAFESHRLSSLEPNRSSQSERERSLSVSPKTRLPGQTRISIPPDRPSEIERSRGIKRDREDSEPSQYSMTNGRQSMESNTAAAPTPPPVQAANKRARPTEVPTWALSWRKMKGKQVLTANGKPLPKNEPLKFVATPSSSSNSPVSQKRSPPPQARPVAQVQMPLNNSKAGLGPWEPSITGVQPMDPSCMALADWFFIQVVNRQDWNELKSQGIQVEIEAKLGTLIDAETQARLQLPTQSECVLTPNGMGIASGRSVRWTFSSSMTEGQHKVMNDFLNEKAQESYAKEGRVQVQYKHRRERDRFYELPRDLRKNLPAIMLAKANPNHATKVRVTHDAKTGEQLAKIIKARVADIDVHMPRQPVDCRISINLEMTYNGDPEDFVETVAQRSPDRIKDRLSYTHSHYQFDLTQVTMASGSQKLSKEHELEIELSTDALVDQGKRAASNQENMYPQLVQGLLDNIRVLARKIPSP